MSLVIPMFPLWRVTFREATAEPAETSDDDRAEARESMICAKPPTEQDVKDARARGRLRVAF